MKIDVCIPTFKRPGMLKRLLESLMSQTDRDQYLASVIIVDNDAECSARSVTELFRRDLNIVYAVEPTQNISAARNKCLDHVTSSWFAFIDDDAYVDNHWLASIVACATRFDADIVMAPPWPTYPEGTPKYLIKSRILDIASPPEGASEGFAYDTCNCLINIDSLRRHGIRFDLDYGLTGGEDVDFFLELRKHDLKFVWTPHAHAFAPLHSGRNFLWPTLRRKFNRGGIHAKVATTKGRHYSAKDLMIVHGAFARAVVIACMTMLALPLLYRMFIRSLGKVAFRLGQLSYLYNNFVSVEYGERSIRAASHGSNASG